MLWEIGIAAALFVFAIVADAYCTVSFDRRRRSPVQATKYQPNARTR